MDTLTYLTSSSTDLTVNENVTLGHLCDLKVETEVKLNAALKIYTFLEYMHVFTVIHDCCSEQSLH